MVNSNSISLYQSWNDKQWEHILYICLHRAFTTGKDDTLSDLAPCNNSYTQIWIYVAFLSFQIQDRLTFLSNMLPSLQQFIFVVTEWKFVLLKLKGILLSLHIWRAGISYVKFTSVLCFDIVCTFSSLTFLYEKLPMAFFRFMHIIPSK